MDMEEIIKIHFLTILNREAYEKILRNEIAIEDSTDYVNTELEKRMWAYIGQRGGIEKIEESRKLVDDAYGRVAEMFEQTKGMDFFEKREKLKPVMKEFYDVIRENYNSPDSAWEYAPDFSKIHELASEDAWYPYQDEIHHKPLENDSSRAIDSLVTIVRTKDCTSYNGKDFFYNRCMDCQRTLNELLLNHPHINKNLSLDTVKDLNLPFNQHCFNIVNYNGRNYVIDPSYVQFCDNSATLDILGVPEFTALPGHFLMEEPEKKELLHELIKFGFFEITPEKLKMYLDSFVLSNRDAEFYKKHPGISTTETELTWKDYMAIIEGRKQYDFLNAKEVHESVAKPSVEME